MGDSHIPTQFQSLVKRTTRGRPKKSVLYQALADSDNKLESVHSESINDLKNKLSDSKRLEMIAKMALRGSSKSPDDIPTRFKILLSWLHFQTLAENRIPNEKDLVQLCKVSGVDLSEWNTIFSGPVGASVIKWLEDLALKRINFKLSRVIDAIAETALDTSRGMAHLKAADMLLDLTGTKRRAGLQQSGYQGVQWANKYLIDKDGRPLKPPDKSEVSDGQLTGLTGETNDQ